MKIRNGFVSNSSSSSFVICGFKLKNEDPVSLVCKIMGKTQEEVVKEKNIDKEDLEEYCQDLLQDNDLTKFGVDVVCGAGTIVGISFFEENSSYSKNKNMSLEELAQKIKAIKDKLNISDEVEAKIYSGSRMT